jgi:hypothetical protein
LASLPFYGRGGEKEGDLHPDSKRKEFGRGRESGMIQPYPTTTNKIGKPPTKLEN